MPRCFFVSDLHGRPERYRQLFARIVDEKPAAAFLGGDLLPSGVAAGGIFDGESGDFINDFLVTELERIRRRLGGEYPRIFLILGNDDGRGVEDAVRAVESRGLWEYVHERRAAFAGYDVYGYCCVPPTPFLNKDWERYDVSRHVDPGCVAPEDGYRSAPALARARGNTTIREELEELANGIALDRAIFLFHAPPYGTNLDRAALDGKMIDFAPLDVHVGSIAIRRFIEERRPRVTLHGHVHESARLTGCWSERIGETYCLSAAHDGPQLALIRFDPDDPKAATRELL